MVIDDRRLLGLRKPSFEALKQAHAFAELLHVVQGRQVGYAPDRVGNDQRLMSGAEEAGPVGVIADGDEIRQREVGIAQLGGGDSTDARIGQAAYAFSIA